MKYRIGMPQCCGDRSPVELGQQVSLGALRLAVESTADAGEGTP